MVQGYVKSKKGNVESKNKNNRLVKAELKKMKFAKKGSGTKISQPVDKEDRLLSKAIDKASEQKMAAKVIQGGGRLTTTDLMQRGKELNKETRRSQVKKKLGRVEEKLKAIREAAEKQGKI
jgi:hypothetical protein